MQDWVVSLGTAKSMAPEPGQRSALFLRHGTMSLRFYAPKGTDLQTPHDQDEVYVVATGSGFFVCGPNENDLKKRAFGPGTAIFVPAGYVHRFIDFSADFATWVVFWGPPGGESDKS